jgi:hypothetical protein
MSWDVRRAFRRQVLPAHPVDDISWTLGLINGKLSNKVHEFEIFALRFMAGF